MKIEKIDNETYRCSLGSKPFTIKKVTKWVWQAFDEQGVKVTGARAQSVKKVGEALNEKFTDKDLTVPPITDKETVEEFLQRGGEVKSLPEPRVKELPIRGPETALKVKFAARKKTKSKKPKTAKTTNTHTRDRIRSQENVVTLQELIDEWGINGMKARKILRGSGIEKPGKQWIWDKGGKNLKKVRDYFENYLGIESAVNKVKKTKKKK